MSEKPELISARLTRLSPWAELSERTYRIDGEPQTFHAIKPQDYVSVLGITGDGRIPLVRQFRPALDAFTLELPGGLLEEGETSAARAIREIAEETGFTATLPPIAFPVMHPDTGRLANMFHAFMLRDLADPAPDWQPERGVECVVFTRRELAEALDSERFNHALHIGIIGLALLKGLLQLTP